MSLTIKIEVDQDLPVNDMSETLECYYKISESEQLTLLTLQTSDSRELSRNIPEITFNKETELTKELLSWIVSYYKEEIKTLDRVSKESQKDVDDLKKMIPRASSDDMFDRLYQELKGYKNSIQYCKEQIGKNELLLQRFEYLGDILEENKDKLLYYIRY